MKTKVRKKAEVEEIQKEREKEREERRVQNEAWHKFWEKDNPVNEKKLKKGGFKRPKGFNFDNESLNVEPQEGEGFVKREYKKEDYRKKSSRDYKPSSKNSDRNKGDSNRGKRGSR